MRGWGRVNCACSYEFEVIDEPRKGGPVLMGSPTMRSHIHPTNAMTLICLAGFSPACADAASFQGVGDLPGGFVSSDAQGVSADGQVVVGLSYSATSANQPEAYRWTQAGGIVGLAFSPQPFRAAELLLSPPTAPSSSGPVS